MSFCFGAVWKVVWFDYGWLIQEIKGLLKEAWKKTTTTKFGAFQGVHSNAGWLQEQFSGVHFSHQRPRHENFSFWNRRYTSTSLHTGVSSHVRLSSRISSMSAKPVVRATWFSVGKPTCKLNINVLTTKSQQHVGISMTCWIGAMPQC